MSDARIDPHSPTWAAVEKAATEILGAAREKTEEPDYPHDKTQFERGRISAMRAILKLAAPAKPAPEFGKPPTY